MPKLSEKAIAASANNDTVVFIDVSDSDGVRLQSKAAFFGGATGSFTDPAGQTIVVANGIVTDIINPFLISLSAHYSMDEASGARGDSTPNGLDLTDNNTVTSIAGKVGSAAQFTIANTEYLSRVDNPLFEITGDWAVVFWFKFDALGNEEFITWKGTSTTVGTEEYYVLKRSTNRLRFVVSNGSTYSVADHGTTLSTDTWYFVHAYYDQSAQEIGISVDNGAAATAAMTTTPLTTAGAFQIGARNGAQSLGGAVDLFSLYQRNLTAAEVTTHYNGGSGVAYPFL